MTYPERLLWSRLRGSRLGNVRFRRQEPIGPYVADFCCVSAQLVVELDGRSHEDPEYDDRRDDWMKGLGWRVIRFSNDLVLQELDWVVARIAEAAGVDLNG